MAQSSVWLATMLLVRVRLAVSVMKIPSRTARFVRLLLTIVLY